VIARSRQIVADDERFRGLYISEQDVDALMKEPFGHPRWLRNHHDDNATVYLDTYQNIAKCISKKEEESRKHGITLRLSLLRERFGLESFDIDALLICLAGEIDLRYERLYAYLQDDVTKKRPCIDLVLNLLVSSPRERLSKREHFAPTSPLIRHRLLEYVEDTSTPKPSLLATYLKIDDRITAYLLGSDELDARLNQFSRTIDCQRNFSSLIIEQQLKNRMQGLLQKWPDTNGSVLYLQGPYGVGKQPLAEALCSQLGLSMLVINLDGILCDDHVACQSLLELIYREARLDNYAIFFKGIDQLTEEHSRALLDAFIATFNERPSLTFLSADSQWKHLSQLQRFPLLVIDVPLPDAQQRANVWQQALLANQIQYEQRELIQLASKYKLTPGKITEAAGTASRLAHWHDAKMAEISLKELHEACRLHSNQKLSELARKIPPKYRWRDIVLPQDRLEQLRDICHFVKYRSRVYEEWGFDHKLALGKGLNVLFAGPSGTGKTMAADIIAGELGLDLYKIDLSTVVSKYIGETEKNLSRIFSEAETSNAILFFDEADSLFGKRSEVKDAHDRYANIETGYLLQRMEEYEGIVILATNLRKNIDEAFVRRLHATIDFPFPDEVDRRNIWERIWPESTPRASGLDLDMMAKRFEITGGNIRNIALAAAFLAADDTDEVNMVHI
ncbi:MAG: AAA family ATPase, partial [Gammaproteobacteria bacterium]|nr:AAA family ATPase [Gammaproteobacteria bacterium]